MDNQFTTPYQYIEYGSNMAGTICLVLSLFMSPRASYGLQLTGYCLVIIASIVFFIQAVISNNQSKETAFNLKNEIIKHLPTAYSTLTMGYMVVMLSIHREKIVNNHIYSTYSIFSTLIWILCYALTQIKFNSHMKLLISIFIFSCAVSIYIILNKYITDGFHTRH
jgi:hypothetical protein